MLQHVALSMRDLWTDLCTCKAQGENFDLAAAAVCVAVCVAVRVAAYRSVYP